MNKEKTRRYEVKKTTMYRQVRGSGKVMFDCYGILALFNEIKIKVTYFINLSHTDWGFNA